MQRLTSSITVKEGGGERGKGRGERGGKGGSKSHIIDFLSP